MAIIDQGGLTTQIGSVDPMQYLSLGFLTQALFWILGLGVVVLLMWLVFDMLRTHAKALVYDEVTREYKNHLIKKDVNKKRKTTNFFLSKTKEKVSKECADNLFRISKKKNYLVTLSRGIDGELRPLKPAIYQEEDGRIIPYYEVVPTNLKDHIWHSMKEDIAKFSLKSTLEVLSPYATFALVAIMSMMFHYVVGQ